MVPNCMVPNRMVPNRMVRVGGVRCSHHNGAREDHSGLPRGHARLTDAEPRGTRPPVDLQKRKYGAAARRGSPTSLKIGPGGTAGATSTEWWLFCSSVPRSGTSSGRNAPFLGSRMYEFTFLGP